MTTTVKQPRVRLISRELKLVALMAQHWFREFDQLFRFPANYTTLDLETSGLNPATKLICTYGYTVVRDHKPVETREVVLDWSRHPDADIIGLQKDLSDVQRAFERKGKVLHHTYEYLTSQGIDPIQALNDLLLLVETAENNKEILILHNGWAFDIEFIKAAFHNWLRIRWEFEPNLIYDSGIIEKASQLPERFAPLPLPGETMKAFATRIHAIRSHVKWNLDTHCAERYGLMQKANLITDDMHKASTDALAVHYLVEEHYKLANIADQLDPDSQDNQSVVGE